MSLHRRRFLKGLLAGLAATSLASYGGLVGPDGVTPLRQTAAANSKPARPRRASGGVQIDAASVRTQKQLLDRAKKQPNGRFRVIVQRRGGDRRADQALGNRGSRKLREMKADAYVAEVDARDLDSLINSKHVKYVSLDAPVHSTGTVSSANLTQLYSKVTQSSNKWAAGVTGLGIGIAVVDSGITYRNDFKNSAGASRIVLAKNFTDDTAGTNDPFGHGTHVAAIAAGNSWWVSGAAQGRYIGTAPEANLINVRVASHQGQAYTSDLVDGIEWVIANRVAYNIRVMNISMVQAEPESYYSSLLCAAVERAWFNGIVVVVAAGNTGPHTMYYPPANDPFVITVGATDPLGTVGWTDDFIAPWSSYGITQDYYYKPDLVTTGRYMGAAMTANSAPLFASINNRILDSTYIWLSGTSMAAAAVSGAVAQLLQARPNLTNDQVKWLLMTTAAWLNLPTLATYTIAPVDEPWLQQGGGSLQIASAIDYTGVVYAENQGLEISGQLLGPNGQTIYNTSSWSSSSWSSSSWSTSSWSTSSWSSSSWSSSSWSSSSWATSVSPLHPE